MIVRVLLGQVRFLMEPQQDECFGICTMFRKNPVLKQGDACESYLDVDIFNVYYLAVVFDQRAWTYLGISWTDVTLISTQLVSWA